MCEIHNGVAHRGLRVRLRAIKILITILLVDQCVSCLSPIECLGPPTIDFLSIVSTIPFPTMANVTWPQIVITTIFLRIFLAEDESKRNGFRRRLAYCRGCSLLLTLRERGKKCPSILHLVKILLIESRLFRVCFTDPFHNDRRLTASRVM